MDIVFFVTLGFLSILAVTYIVERGLALRWTKVIPPAVQSAVESYRASGDLPLFRGVCEQNPSPAARLLLFAMEHLDWPKIETSAAVETRARHEIAKLERGLVVLEIIVGIAPLLGLVGTIYGLIILFGGMNANAAVDNGSFARGVSTALYATFLGLLVAIPALVGWSYYSKKVESLTVEMETLCDEFLRKHYRKESGAATRATVARAP